MHTLTDNTRSTEPIYWTHSDHLGSTSWVTDLKGLGVQHFRYLPFGEPLYSKKTGTFSSRYTFSGKERDSESGLNYFGARYYNSSLSIWLSVDPLSDKYPNLSPYTYCADNPVMIIDPDGRDTIFVDKKTGKTNIYNRVGNDVLVCGKRTVTLSRKGIYKDAVSKGKAQGHEDVTLLVGMSSSDARKTFNFMADNTGVEWGYMESVNNNGQTEFLVGSAHNPDTESLIYVKAMCAPEGSVLRYDHSHIYPIHGSSWQKATAGMPSTSSTSANSKKYSDIEAWNDLVRKNPSISIGIRYNKQTIIYVKKGIWQ